VEWIVSRTLADDCGNEVTVALAAPYALGPGDWICPYEVSNVSEIQEIQARQAHGIDALQALLLALEDIRLILEQTQKALTWKGGEPGDTGIPRWPTMVWGLSLRRHIESIIGVEEQFWKSWLEGKVHKWSKKVAP
jgi:hypothetical protein